MEMTTDREEIKTWVEEHDGKPAIIDHPEAGSDKVGIRIDFRGKTDEALLSDSYPLKNISWDEFFKIFDDQQLIFVYDKEVKVMIRRNGIVLQRKVWKLNK